MQTLEDRYVLALQTIETLSTRLSQVEKELDLALSLLSRYQPPIVYEPEHHINHYNLESEGMNA